MVFGPSFHSKKSGQTLALLLTLSNINGEKAFAILSKKNKIPVASAVCRSHGIW
jgi:hypothetical protein